MMYSHIMRIAHMDPISLADHMFYNYILPPRDLGHVPLLVLECTGEL